MRRYMTYLWIGMIEWAEQISQLQSLYSICCFQPSEVFQSFDRSSFETPTSEVMQHK